MGTQRFGFLPQDWTLQTRSLRIEPLPNHAHVVSTILSSERVLRGWYYPPIHAEHSFHHADVHVPDHVFSLPSTHEIHSIDPNSLDPEFAGFVVTTLGFIVGMRLGLDGWSHYYRAPTRKGELVDFFCAHESAEHILQKAEEYWSRNQHTEVANFILGAMHWYLFSQSYQHAFEVLAAQCTVLDTCWRLFQLTDRHAPHKDIALTDRPERLCAAFGIPLPEWARGGRNNPLARIRSGLFYEGKFDGEPVGFAAMAAHPEPLHKEIIRLNARLIVALLGLRSSYVTTSVADPQLHDLSI